MYNILRKPGPAESNKFAHITYKLLPCYLWEVQKRDFFSNNV